MKTNRIENVLANMSEDERMLRQMLWEEHSCDMKYGDDGERQCGACVIDFMRDSVETIREQINKRNHKRLIEFCQSEEGNKE